jgi:pyruvate formate lyase activating enzyme
LQTQALIFDIQDLSVQDGPGIRTTVFMKGCPLKCNWCANPEGQKPFPEMMHLNVLCNQTYNCILACSYNAIKKNDDDNYPLFNRVKCQTCPTRECVDSCPTFAIKYTGKYITVRELIDIVKPNLPYYKNSGGGVTFSGGEPFLQSEFIRKFINETSKFGLSVGVETCGMFDWSEVQDIIGKFDFFYFDLKCMDSEIHKTVTGSSNITILNNLKNLAVKYYEKIIVSVPVVPGVNDSAEQIKKIADFCKKIGIGKIRLLPYHSLGESKYVDLGRKYSMNKNLSVPAGQISVFKSIIESDGIKCWLE